MLTQDKSKCASVDFGAEDSTILSTAILLYANKNKPHATVHGIHIDSEGQPSLLPGTSLAYSTLSDLIRTFTTDSKVGMFLPENVLSIGMDSLVWYCKPAKRRISFSCSQGGIGQESAVVPHPGLIFAVRGTSWSVFAVKGNSRPTASTPLFQAPYFNVWEGGGICTGSAEIPDGQGIDTISKWESAFFDSQFSHPNIHAPKKLVDFEGGSYGFWRSMLDGKHKKFPAEVMIPLNATAGDLVNQINGASK